jgi:hypothetical protein
MARKKKTHKSKAVKITLLASMAAAAMALGGCSDGNSNYKQTCVDNTGKVVDSSYCQKPRTGGGGFYYWYWANRSFPHGSVVNGGSYTPPKSGFFGGASRGGFGSSAVGRGAGA